MFMTIVEIILMSSDICTTFVTTLFLSLFLLVKNINLSK